MYAEERRQKIRTIISEYKKVNVIQLSKYFSVSEVTIRKDLALLEKEGLLIRTHGGAVISDKVAFVDQYLKPVDDAENLAKRSIARELSRHVLPGNLIFLGAGTTCTEIARELSGKERLTVITNNMTAAMVLSGNINIEVFVIGGNLYRRRDNYTLIDRGIMDFFTDKYVDKIIITVDGISFKSGLTIHNEILAESYRHICEMAESKIICAISDKFNKNAFSSLSPLSGPDIFITDSQPPQGYMEYFTSHDVEVYIAGS
jgi:DeoR/GlpR family transcriptional regulator of sugar metabolism